MYHLALNMFSENICKNELTILVSLSLQAMVDIYMHIKHSMLVCSVIVKKKYGCVKNVQTSEH